MNFRALLFMAAICAALTPAVGASYTTTTEDLKISIQLDLLEPQCYYEFDGSTLSWREPAAADSHYLKLVLRDAGGTGTIPGCKAAAVITTGKGKPVGTSITLQETWDRTLPHYGDNIQLPDDITSAKITLKIDPPKGRRLGRDVGDFFTKPIVVTFPGVDLSPVEKSNPNDDKPSGPVQVEWPEGRRPYVAPTPYPGAK